MYTSIRSRTPETFALSTIWSRRNPYRSAAAALSKADTTIASIITSRAGRGSTSFEFSSIILVSNAWSSEPQFTPIRTGFRYSTATSTMVRKLSSSLRPIEQFPGLILYFDNACAAAGYLVSSRCPL